MVVVVVMVAVVLVVALVVVMRFSQYYVFTSGKNTFYFGQTISTGTKLL